MGESQSRRGADIICWRTKCPRQHKALVVVVVFPQSLDGTVRKAVLRAGHAQTGQRLEVMEDPVPGVRIQEQSSDPKMWNHFGPSRRLSTQAPALSRIIHPLYHTEMRKVHPSFAHYIYQEIGETRCSGNKYPSWCHTGQTTVPPSLVTTNAPACLWDLISLFLPPSNHVNGSTQHQTQQEAHKAF